MVIKYKNQSSTVSEQMYLNAILQFHLSHKWIRLNSCQLLHLSTQLDNTKLGQPVTKQCLILFSLWCKNVTLAVQEKNTFYWYIFINITGRPLYEEFRCIICHSLIYFAILT